MRAWSKDRRVGVKFLSFVVHSCCIFSSPGKLLCNIGKKTFSMAVRGKKTGRRGDSGEGSVVNSRHAQTKQIDSRRRRIFGHISISEKEKDNTKQPPTPYSHAHADRQLLLCSHGGDTISMIFPHPSFLFAVGELFA